MQRSRIILFVLAVLLVVLAFPGIAGADEAPDVTPSGEVTATEPVPDGWTWDEAAAPAEAIVPDGWTWDEAPAPAALSDQ
jgi:hypothetical protein